MFKMFELTKRTSKKGEVYYSTIWHGAKVLLFKSQDNPENFTAYIDELRAPKEQGKPIEEPRQGFTPGQGTWDEIEAMARKLDSKR